MAQRGRRLKNKEELKAWVMRQLGAPRVKVELHDDHLEDAFEDAMDWYTAYRGVKRSALLSVTANRPDYPAPPDADTVLNVVMGAPPFDLSIVFQPYILADENIPYDVFAAPESSGLYSSLAQAIQYTEMAQRILSAESDWMYDEATRKIILTPVPRKSGDALVEYSSSNVTVDQLSAFEHRMFKRYMLSRAKIVLGKRIRGKYGSVPTAAGEREIRDAEDMAREGREEIEKLTEELRGSGYPLPIVTG